MALLILYFVIILMGFLTLQPHWMISLDQLPSLKKKFPTYKDYAVAMIHDLFTNEELESELSFKGTNDAKHITWKTKKE